MDYSILADDELLDLLITEEDRLTRAAVDEMIRRRERMIPMLSEIVSDQFAWTREPPDWWAVVHAVYILGAIGTEAAVLPLLRALRWADAFDCDWVTESLPVMFGRIGPVAIGPLKAMAGDRTNGCFLRGMAMEGLGLIAWRHFETRKEINAFIHAIFMDEKGEMEARQSAGGVLLDLRAEEYKDDLLAFGRQEEDRKGRDPSYFADFFVDDVEEAFKGAGTEMGERDKDWMSFYAEEEIEARQARWKKEEADRRAENSVLLPEAKIGRNDPCPCGSGKKHKKCCLGKTKG